MNRANWFKCFCDFYSEPRVRMIKKMKGGERILIILEQMKCIAAQERNSGTFLLPTGKPYTVELIAVAIDYPVRVVEEAIGVLLDFGLLLRDEGGVISIADWSELQTLDKDAAVKEQTRQRVARYRQRHKGESDEERNADVTQCNDVVTQCNADDKTKQNNTKQDYTRQEKEPPKAPPKEQGCARGDCLAFGEFSNVLLTSDEYERFKSKFPEDYNERINELSTYIASLGDHYVNHYATLHNWATRDAKQSRPQDSAKPKKERYGSFDPEEAFEFALRRTFD